MYVHFSIKNTTLACCEKIFILETYVNTYVAKKKKMIGIWKYIEKIL